MQLVSSLFTECLNRPQLESGKEQENKKNILIKKKLMMQVKKQSQSTRNLLENYVQPENPEHADARNGICPQCKLPAKPAGSHEPYPNLLKNFNQPQEQEDGFCCCKD